MDGAQKQAGANRARLAFLKQVSRSPAPAGFFSHCPRFSGDRQRLEANADVMNRILSSSLVTVTAATAVVLPAAAAASESAAHSPYQLNPEQANYRLAEPYKTRSAPRGVPTVSPQFAERPYADLIHRAAHAAGLEPALVHAVIHVESRYDAKARSPKGAIGLMQVLPQTALRYGVRNAARSPEANLRVGTQYLRDLMELFSGRLDLALAAYNAGEEAVVRYGERIPPYRETQRYVPAVLSKYREWRDLSPSPPERTQIEYLPGTRLETQHDTR